MTMHRNILISGVNWLGDCCMTMPALQLLKHKHPEARLTMLAKAKMIPLWEMQPAISETIALQCSPPGTFATAWILRKHRFDAVYICPNSVRSALIPFLAGIPKRVGVAGHRRRALLTDLVDTDGQEEDRQHQMWEYVRLLQLEAHVAEMTPPALRIPPQCLDDIRTRLNITANTPWIGMLPGAARGPSKQWPAEHFVDAAKALQAETGGHVVLLGTASEEPLCRSIADAIGDGAYSLAGRTTMQELAATLSMCRCVICNDSGGMHLAAATGARVVALFGLTDPGKTGPIGHGHQLIMADQVDQRSRDIKRVSMEAAQALRSIPPARGIDAALAILEDTP